MKVATIVARRDLARARVLASSLARHEPAATLYALVLDATGEDPLGAEPFELLLPAALEIDDFELLAAEFDEERLREVCQPLLLSHLLGGSDEVVLYVASDSLVLGALGDVEGAAQEAGVVLWARVAAPLPVDGRRPHEADLREWGLYDDGLVALAGGVEHSDALAWWAERARLPRSSEQGVAALDRLASLGARVLADPGVGASFWNLAGRTVEQRGEDVVIDGAPLRLLRLSGFDPREPQLLSSYQNRLHTDDMPPLRRICDAYAAELAESGEQAARELPYRWDALPDGTRLDARLRAIWSRARAAAGLRSSPFSVAGMEEFYAWLAAPPNPDAAPGVNRLAALVCELQPEIAAAFADLSDPAVAQALTDWLNDVGAQAGTLPASLLAGVSADHAEGARVHGARERIFGVNVAGYFSSESGVGEAARLLVAALDSVGVPLLPIHIPDAPPTRDEHPYETVPASVARFPFNLICVNADGLPAFRRVIGRSYFEDRYNIGVWWWEVGRVPAELLASFDHLDELWVGSEHVARAFAAESPVPLYTITLPVIRPAVDPLPRAAIGLEASSFVFLFTFDYNSVFERKNPLATIEAFTRAFEPGSGAVLVIKAINGEHDRANRERLRRAAAGHPDVHLLEGHMSTQDNHALIAASDCYVSLHRSEGFGLTPAEAMALGKPVIATAYSGNLDYMTPSNSYLVDYRMTAIGPGNAPYPPDGEWAQPDVEHAARLMREVVADRAAARARGERAAADVARTHSLATAGTSMRRRLEGLRGRVDFGERELIARFDPVELPALVREPGVRGRMRRAIGHYVGRSIGVDMAAVRDSFAILRDRVNAQDGVTAAVDLLALEATRDIASTQAATLAALRRLELARTNDDPAGPAAMPAPVRPSVTPAASTHSPPEGDGDGAAAAVREDAGPDAVALAD
jgi:glycosyltransferase involved in cell wall biosynthesis